MHSSSLPNHGCCLTTVLYSALTMIEWNCWFKRVLNGGRTVHKENGKEYTALLLSHDRTNTMRGTN